MKRPTINRSNGYTIHINLKIVFNKIRTDRQLLSITNYQLLSSIQHKSEQ